MPMDVDVIAAIRAVDELNDILIKMPHGDRAEIADDYIEFASRMRQKYGNPSDTHSEGRSSDRCNDEYANAPNNEWQDMLNGLINYTK